MARRWFADAVPAVSPAVTDQHPLALAAAKACQLVLEGMGRLDFRQAAEAALQLSITANGFLNDQTPWSRIKRDSERQQVADDLYVVLEASRLVALLLAPLLPDLSGRMMIQLGQVPLAGGADVPQACPPPWLDQLRWGGLLSGLPLPDPEPVMARLEPMAPF
jgi:methionyl-tRNA synthetase